MLRTNSKIAVGLFFGIATLVFAFHANRVVATNDEGIVLDAAQRMLGGAQPYTDFFGYMSPGSYWLQELVFRICGVALWSGRLIVVTDFALQCALVFWLVARLGSVRAAGVATALYFGFGISDPSFLTAQHRWDSATFALAAVCVTIHAARSWHWLAAGAVYAAAAWCTPSMALAGAVTAGFLLMRDRRAFGPFAVGIAAVTAAAAGTLASAGSLTAFIKQVMWLQHNYAGLNYMPYGAIIGGYRALFEGVAGAGDLSMRAVLVGCVALPAILPVLAILLCAAGLRRFGSDRHWIVMLMATVVALVASTYPRSDVEHLSFVAAASYALVAIAFSRVIPARVGATISTAALVFACVFASNFFATWRNTRPVASPLGTLRVEAGEVPQVAAMLSRVQRGQHVFVYPYMPIDYFLTQAQNPTRFSFLDPGMMSQEDSLQALQALRAQPPESVLYLKLSATELQRVFPQSATLHWHYDELEQWLDQNYEPVVPAVSVGGYQLYQRRVQPPSRALVESVFAPPSRARLAGKSAQAAPVPAGSSDLQHPD